MKPYPLILLIIVSLLAASCMQATPALPPVVVAEPAPTLSESTAAPATPAYEPVFEAAPCPFTLPPDEVEGETLTCGFVVVPEERSDPESPSIRIALAVFKSESDSPAPDPVILLSGGPGEKTLANAVAASSILAGFRGDRDLIIFDQRGVGLSEPALECPEHLEALFDMLDEADSSAALRMSYDALMACGDRLVAEGHNLSAYNTTANAADVDDIRRALGYEQLNLYGGSYGSLLSQAVLRDYPASVRSAILGAVLPAQKSFLVQSSLTTTDAVLRLLDQCAADEACSAAYPDLTQVLYDTIEHLNDEPVPVTLTNPLDGQDYDALLTGDDVFADLVTFLYFTDIIPVLPQAISDVANGDYELMTQLSSQRLALFDALSRGMELSVLCAEDLIGVTAADVLDARTQIPPQLAGRDDPEDALEYGLFGVCQNWPVAQADPSIKRPVSSQVPTLLLEGEMDPVTPPSFAREVAGNLGNSRLYIFPGVGHNVLVGSRCAFDIAQDFLADPAAEPDSSCLDDLGGVVFDLPVETAGQITLKPVTNAASGLSSVAPEQWEEVGPGTFLRRENALDPTALVFDVLPTDADQVPQFLAAQLALDEAPEGIDQREANGLAWDLYSLEVQGIVVDFAVAGREQGGSLLILLQSRPEERDGLLESVLLPAVDELRIIEAGGGSG